MKKMLVVLTLVLLLMAVAEYFSIDPVWFLTSGIFQTIFPPEQVLLQ